MTSDQTTQWLTGLTVFLGFLGAAIGLIGAFVVKYKGQIVALIQAVRDIHSTVDPKSPQQTPAPLPAAIASRPLLTKGLESRDVSSLDFRP